MIQATRPNVLVVDDVRANRELLEGLLDALGYDVREATDGLEALDAIGEQEPDLILLDIDMPRMDGVTLCRRLKADPVRRLIPIVLVTAYQDRETRLRGLEAGADDFLTKPIDTAELRTRTKSLLRDRELNKQLDAAEGIVLTLARIVEARDRYTIFHAERVGLYSREVGQLRSMPADSLDDLYKGGILHDLGKIVVPVEILSKPGPLTPDERVIMERHAPEGAALCGSLRSIARIVPVIRHHHERPDGLGYPDRLVGPDIPWAARVAAVADGWDAMTSDRPYRAALDLEEATARLRGGAGTQWDPEIVEAFLRLIDEGMVERVAAAQLRARRPEAA